MATPQFKRSDIQALGALAVGCAAAGAMAWFTSAAWWVDAIVGALAAGSAYRAGLSMAADKRTLDR